MSETDTQMETIHQKVADIVAEQPVVDLHTHLYGPAFGTPLAGAGEADERGLMLWGIDELLTYHYLVAELFRTVTPGELTPERYYAMDKRAQADLIWQKLFIERSPISEACRGVVTTLDRLGLDVSERDLAGYRAWFDAQDPSEHIDRVMLLAGVESITMTNDVFDPNERGRWLDNPSVGDDPRFTPVLRFDQLIIDWPWASGQLNEWGYSVSSTIDDNTIGEVKRFLGDWLDRTQGVYTAVSLPHTFAFPAGPGASASEKAGLRVLTEAVLPVCEERGLPFAMMIGVTRGVNPPLRGAGDMGFKADVTAVTNLCAAFPRNKFMVTLLSREDQHELAVAARKFGNLMVFGCWWFLNNPSLIEEITRLRTELLGTSFIPQHSDCRVLEQLLYKWDHSRPIIAKVLGDKFADIEAAGWTASDDEIKRDVDRLLRSNFLEFIGK
ncbi:MAG: glucuronate isomerase [Planctomycetota bacterium]|jgi:hypothetical protein